MRRLLRLSPAIALVAFAVSASTAEAVQPLTTGFTDQIFCAGGRMCCCRFDDFGRGIIIAAPRSFNSNRPFSRMRLG